MKAKIRELLRDIKAAALFGQPETIALALDRLRSIPAVAANNRMSGSLTEQVILPAGLSLSRLESKHLRPLLNDPLAAIRAVGAVGLAHRFLLDKNTTQKDLRRPGSDPRPDVRTALGRSLFEAWEVDPERLLNLGTAWLAQPSPKLRHSALIFIPALAPTYGQHIVDLLEPMGADEDRDVRAALADALKNLAGAGLAESVLGLLAAWVTESIPNSWVICRVLSGSWAASHPAEVESILQELQSQTGKTSDISNALRALKRHKVSL
ncbi:MAG: hypothetical protein KKD28_04745 [Chloroflexi bacterium]|nr:hypothetical protein [Chloroflexota bacterium]MBU1660763.1 hypothetical protein [Chloroflexota bacterium]